MSWGFLSLPTLTFPCFPLFVFLVRNSLLWPGLSWYLHISTDHPKDRTNKGPSDQSFSSGDTVWTYDRGLRNHGSPSLQATHLVHEFAFRFPLHPYPPKESLLAWEQLMALTQDHSLGLSEALLLYRESWLLFGMWTFGPFLSASSPWKSGYVTSS